MISLQDLERTRPVSKTASTEAPLPNTLVVGAAKAGTTWLNACFEEHPQAFVPNIGEVDFFSRHYERGFDWYRSIYRGVGSESAIVDVSPTYMVTHEVPARVAKWRPDARLLFVFRNPIARAYSHYCMYLRAGAVSDDVDHHLRPGSRLVDDGVYFTHLRRFLDHFDRKQLGCFFFDDLNHDPAEYLTQVLGFVGIDSQFQPSLLNTRYHARKARPRNLWLYSTLVSGYRWCVRELRVRWLTRTLDSMRRRGWVDVFHQFNRGDAFPPLPAHTTKRLVEHYQEDVTRLGRFVGRDLSHWLRTDES